MKLTEQQLRFFHTFGYLHFAQLFAADEMTWITREFETALNTFGGGNKHDGSKRTMMLAPCDRTARLCTLVDDPRIVGIASDLDTHNARCEATVGLQAKTAEAIDNVVDRDADQPTVWHWCGDAPRRLLRGCCRHGRFRRRCLVVGARCYREQHESNTNNATGRGHGCIVPTNARPRRSHDSPSARLSISTTVHQQVLLGYPDATMSTLPIKEEPDPRHREVYDLAVRIGLAWRELRRGASTSGLRDFLYGSDEESIEQGQMDTLDILAQRPSWKMSELADALRVEPSTATRAVERLVKAGMAERQASADDGRVVRVLITPVGRSVHQTVVERRTELLTFILKSYRRSELPVFADMLERMVTAVDEFVLTHPAAQTTPVAQ